MPIFDQGYQHWSGKLSGHSWRWLAIARHGVRVGLKARVLRTLLILAWMPALALAGMVCLWGLIERQSAAVTALTQVMLFLSPGMVHDPSYYRIDIWRLSYGIFLQIEIYYSIILILLAGPNLISQDLRFNAMPLYFSRPLRRIDYFLGKLGIIVAYLGMVMIVPSVVAYFLGLLFSLHLDVIKETLPLLVGSVTLGVIVSLSTGLLILALSALSRNSRYVALFWVVIVLGSGVLGTVLQAINQEQHQRVYYRKLVRLAPVPRYAPGVRPTTQQMDETRKQNQAWQLARRQAENELLIERANDSKTDWRQLISFTGNLSRLSQELIGTDESWRRLSLLQKSELDQSTFANRWMGPQYPWYWSAGVLLGLSAVSVLILTSSVKSMDRLK